MESKSCQCALGVLTFMEQTKLLLDIYNEQAKTGRLNATAREIIGFIEKANSEATGIGETCNIDVSGAKYLLDGARCHYEGGLLTGDIHNLTEAAEMAAEAELPLLRELLKCAES